MALKETLKKGFGRRTTIVALSAALLLTAGAGYIGWLPGTGQTDKASAGNEQAAPQSSGERRKRPGGAGGPGGPGRPQPVKATEAKLGNLDVVLAALGTVTASNTATVKPRVDGQIVRIHFQEGQKVKAGDLLAEIDARPYQIQLDQIHGQLLKDEALLAAAQVDLERYRGLLAKDSIAKQQVDTQDALVRQYKGSIETDKAQEANARLNLGFTRIAAPASGRIGLRQIDVGNMVRTADSTGIAVITQTQPIHLVFAIPAERLGNILTRLQQGDHLVVEAWDRDNRSLLGTGKLRSVDNQIDVSTGTVRLKAEFANKDDSLFPNQFVNARLKVETRRDAVLLQSAAVQRSPQGTQVYVVGKEEKIESRAVRLGPLNGNLVVIEEGLSPGEIVVLDGADRLQNGGKVEVLSIDGRAAASERGQADSARGGHKATEDRPLSQRAGEGRRENEERRPERRASADAIPPRVSLDLGGIATSLRLGHALGEGRLR